MIEEANFFEILKVCLWGGAFGIVGGIVRMVRYGAKSLSNVICQVIVSWFAGICAYSLLAGNGVTDMMLVGICGIAGNSGGMLLDAIQSRVIHRVRGK